MSTTLVAQDELEAATSPRAEALSPSRYLHLGGDRIYNPLSHETLSEGQEDFNLMRSLLRGELPPESLPTAKKQSLIERRWLASASDDLSSTFYLRYVSLEAHTICNQSCYFCPVSINPREDYFMPTEVYENIVDQLSAYRDTIEGVSMINYNEPTVDKRFLDQVRCLKRAGLPPAVLTNGSGLTPDRIDAILEMGGVQFLSVNMSTLDRDRYQRDRGADHLRAVLRNLDYLKDLPVAPQMELVVLGTGSEDHHRDFREISERFAGSRLEVKFYEVMDRAGYLQIGLRPAQPLPKLCGCENLGSRPLQHLHITPRGNCVLCCEDYDEHYEIGNVNENTIEEILTGPKIALLRRWVYGVEESPAGFMCRKCVFARTA